MNKILCLLESAKLIKSLEFNSTIFYDEPRLFKYTAVLNFPKKYSDGRAPIEPIVAIGTSFVSKDDALQRCLGEAVERLSLYCFQNKSIFQLKERHMVNDALFSLFQYDSNIPAEKIQYVKGTNILIDNQCLLPAQLIYLNFFLSYKDPFLSEATTTGAAGGFNHEETLLRGIYEVVERDAFMTIYLNQITPPSINMEENESAVVKSVVKSCARYQLKSYFFDITTDLSIPIVMALLIDKTGVGPAVTVGLGSGSSVSENILKSIGEALTARIWIRNEMLYAKRTNFPRTSSIETVRERGLYWSLTNRISKLSFLLKKVCKKEKVLCWNNKHKNIQNIITLFKRKKIDIFYKDVTIPLMKTINYRIYKVLIPQLQPLYFNEERKIINHKRLEEVAHFFYQKRSLNIVPHPFL